MGNEIPFTKGEKIAEIVCAVPRRLLFCPQLFLPLQL